MKDAINALREFSAERDWNQFHTPENLAKSISIEAGELLECFQWTSTCDEHNLQAIKEELADVLSYTLMMCDRLGLDPEQIVLEKMELNRKKYPVDKAKGNSKKYTEL